MKRSIIILLIFQILNWLIGINIYKNNSDTTEFNFDKEKAISLYPQAVLSIQNCEREGNRFFTLQDDPQIFILPPKIKISSTLIEFAEPVPINSSVKIYYSKNNEDLNEENSVNDLLPKGNTEVILNLPSNIFTTLRYDIDIFGEWYEIKGIYVFKAVADYTLFITLVISISIFILWVIGIRTGKIDVLFKNIINKNRKNDINNTDKTINIIQDMGQNKILKYPLLWLLPIIYGLFFVVNYGVNVIFWDEWKLVNLYNLVEQNGLFNISFFKMIFSQHNEHRIFFPKLIMLISHKLTHFNVKICMFIMQTMVIAVYGVSTRYLIKKREISSVSSSNFLMTLFVLMNGFAYFSYNQYENFLWGFQVAFYMAIFGAVISLYFFYQNIMYGRKKYCILSLFFGIIASFSCLHGIIVWPIMYILMLGCLVSGKHSIIKKSIPYIIIGAICFIIYFYGWKHPSSHPDFVYNINSILKFFFGTIGGMYTGIYSKLTVVLGGTTVLFSVVLIIIILIKKDIKTALFPVGLIGYSYAALISIAIGRAGFGVEVQSTISRYMSFSVLSYIGINMIVYQCFVLPCDKINKVNIICKKMIYILYIVLFSILLIWGNIKGFSRAKYFYNHQIENMSILQNYEQQPIEKLDRLCPFSTYRNAYNNIGKLEKYNLNVFLNASYSYNAIPRKRFSYLKSTELKHWLGFGREVFTWDKEFITISSGWIIDYLNEKEYTKVYMKVNDKLYRTADHLSSPDVAKHFKNYHYSNVRFSFSFSIDEMNLGENNFSALVILGDGLTYYETDVIKIYKDENGDISF